MKHIYRKPLLPCILLALLVCSVCFLTLFRKTIADGQNTVEEMYRSIQLTFQVLPGTSDSGELRLRSSTAGKILKLEGVAGCSYYFECPYSLRTPVTLPNYSVAYGTNDLSFFEKERGIHITYAAGWKEASVLSPNENEIPCILDSALAELLGIEPGDTFVISPNAGEDTDPESAPSLTLLAAGTFEDEASLVKPYSLLISADAFLSRSGFFYNGIMMGRFYYYRQFHFYTDPAYNRNFQTIRDAANAILETDGDFILYSNARILEQAVRPIEQKVHIQQMLLMPLAILLCAATAIMVVFLCASFSGEVFLRLLWGEPRRRVWADVVCSVLLLLTAAGFLAVGIGWLLCGTRWLGLAAAYTAGVMLVCFLSAAVQLAIFCNRNLVAFYQTREG